MFKEPMTNIVGLKALAWDMEKGTFVSPARPEFVWSPGGLQMSNCPDCGSEPKAECTCGLYVTFDVQIALEYIHYSVISPIFLVEASGVSHIYTDGFRSRELTIHAVAPNDPDDAIAKLAASQAADYFQVKVVENSSILSIIMDLHNHAKFPDVYPIRNDQLKRLDNSTLDALFQKLSVQAT